MERDLKKIDIGGSWYLEEGNGTGGISCFYNFTYIFLLPCELKPAILLVWGIERKSLELLEKLEGGGRNLERRAHKGKHPNRWVTPELGKCES